MPKPWKHSVEEIEQEKYRIILVLTKRGWSSREIGKVIRASYTKVSALLNGTYPHAKLDKLIKQ